MSGRLDGLIFYNPDPAMAERACAQLRSLEGTAVVVVDNSTTLAARRLVDEVTTRWSLTVVRLPKGNVGTAGGLNELIRRAAALNLPWLHYLDQDSVLETGYRQLLEESESCTDTAWIGATYTEPGTGFSSGRGDRIRYCPTRYVISSGSLLSVSACIEADFFSEVMFLDLVDTEMCLRLRRSGHHLAVDHERRMQHSIGAAARRVGPLGITDHPLWRRRLMWRNSVLLARMYAKDFPFEILRHWVVRVLETGLTAVHTRRFAVLGASFLGAREGLRLTTARHSPSAHG